MYFYTCCIWSSDDPFSCIWPYHKCQMYLILPSRICVIGWVFLLCGKNICQRVYKKQYPSSLCSSKCGTCTMLLSTYLGGSADLCTCIAVFPKSNVGLHFWFYHLAHSKLADFGNRLKSLTWPQKCRANIKVQRTLTTE